MAVKSRRTRLRERIAAEEALMYDASDPVPHELVARQEETSLDVMKSGLVQAMAPWIEKLEARFNAGDEAITREEFEADVQDLLDEDGFQTSIYQMADAASLEELAEMKAALELAEAEKQAQVDVPSPDTPPTDPPAEGGETPPEGGV